MCIYFVRNDNNAAEAISFMLKSRTDDQDPGTREPTVTAAFHFIRCQKPERCVGTALMVR